MIQYTRPATHLGKSGTMSVTIDLVPITQLNREAPNFPSGEPRSVMQLVRDGVTNFETPNPITGERIRVSYSQLREEFNEAELENAFLSIKVDFQVDHSVGSPIYPSDMVDELRRRGFSEETIQEMLNWEKSVRGE